MENVDVELGKEVDITAKAVQLLLDCEKKGRNRKSWPIIRMVPIEFRKLSPSSFDPQVVSIGPLHKRNEKFQDFEERKVIYLHEFLSCLNLEPDLTFKSCVQKVIGSIEEIKACYGREITYNDTEFAKTKACYGGEITYNDFAKMMYRNYLREFWATAVAFDSTPSTDANSQRPLREFCISFSVLNGARKFTLDYKTFCSSTGIDYNNGNYVALPDSNEDYALGFLPAVLSPSNFSKDPSSVSNIELTAHMVAVNNQRDSVSPPLPSKKKREV
ncbi:hypothetical protein CTI12_AA617150 [Artemisia annua]|uniref:Uncharacterized protein n=1 Tax=Artemisia annua TaxID=35608 RepID=A0A2U1KD06_ARTAN|nr:hypothetical protein CTI12_AA617150 [Artemisia annua]